LLFQSKSWLGSKFLLYALLTIIVLWVDVQTRALTPLRDGIHWINQASVNGMDWSIRRVGWLWVESGSSGELIRENQWLRKEVLSIQNRLNQKDALLDYYKESEALLKIQASMNNVTSIVAKVLSVSPEPFVQWYIIDKGSRDGVTIGQAVADANGILGQISNVSQTSSKIILITDTRSAIPVKNHRTAQRGLAMGFERQQLKLLNVPSEQDVVIGDEYLTSGMGEVYPKGYSVGVVKGVVKETGTGFSDILLTPKAQFNRTQLVLVLDKAQEKEPHAKKPL